MQSSSRYDGGKYLVVSDQAAAADGVFSADESTFVLQRFFPFFLFRFCVVEINICVSLIFYPSNPKQILSQQPKRSKVFFLLFQSKFRKSQIIQ